MDELLKHIEKSLVDRKRFRKTTRKKFNRYERLLRFHKSPVYLKEYKTSSKDIMEVVFRTIESDRTYDTRNIYFIFAIMDMHFTFYSDMLKRITEIQDLDTLKLAFDSVLQKNAELLKLLNDNEKDPITAEQLEELMEKQKND